MDDQKKRDGLTGNDLIALGMILTFILVLVWMLWAR